MMAEKTPAGKEGQPESKERAAKEQKPEAETPKPETPKPKTPKPEAQAPKAAPEKKTLKKETEKRAAKRAEAKKKEEAPTGAKPEAAKAEPEEKEAETKKGKKKKKGEEEKPKVTLERIYIIPLRDARKAPANRRAKRGVSIVRAFISRHMRSSDVRLDPEVSEYLWMHGMRNIPPKVRVKAAKAGETVSVTLAK